MTRAVLDPGVLVSAFIARRGAAPDRIVRVLYEGEFELVMSPKLIAELTEVLARPKFEEHSASGRAEAFIQGLTGQASHFEDPPHPPRVCRDPKDDYLFALAKASAADILVSGDGDVLETPNANPPVVSPREFVDRLASEGE